MATPVILQMNVHCNGCARKIRKTARDVNGVEDVWESPETGVVVVTGNADAEALRSRIEHKTGRAVVTVVSGGGGGAEDQAPDGWRMTRLASPRQAPLAPDSWWTAQHLPSSRHAAQMDSLWATHSASSRHATPQEAPDHWRVAHLASSRRAPPPPPPPMQGYPPYAASVRPVSAAGLPVPWRLARQPVVISVRTGSVLCWLIPARSRKHFVV